MRMSIPPLQMLYTPRKGAVPIEPVRWRVCDDYEVKVTMSVRLTTRIGTERG